VILVISEPMHALQHMNSLL